MLRFDEMTNGLVRPAGEILATQAMAAVRSNVGRRTVLRGIGLSALTVGGVALMSTWTPAMRRAAAEQGPGTLEGWNRDSCGKNNGNPVDYDPDPDTSGIYQDNGAACNGALFRGSNYCSNAGWHKRNEVEAHPGDGTIDYDAVSNRCWGGSDTKNAWQWSTQGEWYRCSDGRVQVRNGSGDLVNSYQTVCRQKTS